VQMHFNQFLQDVGCELQELLWKDIPRDPAGGELYRLERELHGASLALTQLRISMEELRSRLAEKERRARWLETQVGVYLHIADRANAWRHALDLDRLRRTIDQERARLQRRRQAYQVQLARVQHIRRRMDDFQIDMYSRG
jgi:hypothetical protein